jgi:hypothetical protein
MASSGPQGAPPIVCLLPHYEDSHTYWLIEQLLDEAGFQHTMSAFRLELSVRGVPDTSYRRLSKVGI